MSGTSGKRRAVNMQRLRGFLRKEWLQIIRDPSSIVVAVILPMVMLVRVDVSPALPTLAVATQTSLQATGIFSDGSRRDLD